jgi:hypothetical protein
MFCTRSLWNGARRSQAKRQAGTATKAVWAEFKEFLAKNAYGVTVETAAAEDILAFVRGFWIPRHVGSCRSVAERSGQKVVAVSTVKQVLKHLNKCFCMLGREGNQNPVKSEAVRSFKEGYRKMLHELGVREKKAVVFKEGKIEDLVCFLRNEIGNSGEGIERCGKIQDLTTVPYLWETWVRGKECGRLEKRQVHEKEGIVAAGWSKTVQCEPSSTIGLAKEEGRLAMTFLEACALLIKECEAIGQPVGDGFLFRPMTRNWKSFRSEAITAGALRSGIQSALNRARIFEGETLHSFRRTTAQHAVDVRGFTVGKAMQCGRWKTFSAFKGYVEEVASSLRWDRSP